MTAYDLLVTLQNAMLDQLVYRDTPVFIAVPKADPADGTVLVPIQDVQVTDGDVRLHVSRPRGRADS